MKRTTYLAAGAILATAVFAPGARAAYVVNFVEMGANVVEVGGGTLDLTNLTAGAGAATNSPSVFPAGAFFDSGDTSADVKEYFSISGASNFGSGASVKFASSSSGDGVAIGTRLLFVPEFYISDSPLSETSTYLDATFASLGMTPGQYVYTWGAGDHAELVHDQYRREPGSRALDLGDDGPRLRRAWLCGQPAEARAARSLPRKKIEPERAGLKHHSGAAGARQTMTRPAAVRIAQATKTDA